MAAASVHLERALYGEPAETRSRKGPAASLILHGLAIFYLLPGAAGTREIQAAKPEPQAIPIFVPAPVAGEPPRPRNEAPALRAGLPPVIQAPVEATPDVAVDLSTIQLSFADDVPNQLPDVVQAQHGRLALLDKEDQNIARYIFQPPDWQVREAITDVSGQLRLLMDPPQKWSIFRTLAERYGIALDRYQASAIFDVRYRECIQAAIRRRALAGSAPLHARVSAARLAFAARSACGVEVLEVSVAANPAL